jgi:hypothetical protein
VWWLLCHPDLAPHERYALFISNEAEQCPLWAQRAAPEGAFVVWDYHVIAVVRRESPSIVEAWDLDSRLGMPLPLARYLAATFPPQAPTAPPFAPRFRLVAARELLETFRSDRSHMRSGEGWLQPPPPWPALSADSNLKRFVDMTDDIAGEVMDLAGLRRRFEIAEG